MQLLKEAASFQDKLRMQVVILQHKNKGKKQNFSIYQNINLKFSSNNCSFDITLIAEDYYLIHGGNIQQKDKRIIKYIYGKVVRLIQQLGGFWGGDKPKSSVKQPRHTIVIKLFPPRILIFHLTLEHSETVSTYNLIGLHGPSKK
ncbi:Hypothetical_protein [Hexamita inflata]|uniref:Hypothetical_protein n=1 Tax=Hexamita inflata TaxID=28002 RepID=A0AA86QF67_9EUKA|nr:Hypothetical protein HINF_LOCUS45200 [Hexamita inflata]